MANMKSCLILYVLQLIAIPSLGNCPNDIIQVQRDFDLDRFMGTWYVERASQWGWSPLKCIQVDYSKVSPNTFKMVFRHKSNIPVVKDATIEGTSTFLNTDRQGKFMSDLTFVWVSFRIPFWVIGTDYTGYAVIWSCEDNGLFANKPRILIQFRTRNPPSEEVQEAVALLRNISVDLTMLDTVKQNDCFN